MSELSSPPVEFPVYGLDAWAGPQWIELFGERIGDPVAKVCLAHQWPDNRSAVFVSTLSRARFDTRADRHGLDRLADAAMEPAVVLVNLTLPESSVPRPDGLVRALVEHAESRTAGHSAWPVTSWHLDGITAPARVWRFAGGWAAFSDALPEIYLTAAGVANDPDGLEFAQLHDGNAYHFDLTGRLSTRVLTESRAASGAPDLVASVEWHADQLALLRRK